MESMELLILLLLVIFVGFPLIILTYYVVRRMIELHKQMNPSGVLYISKDKEIYLELNDDTIFSARPRSVVLEVRTLKGE